MKRKPKKIAERIFRPARQEARDAKIAIDTPQTHSASYQLAFQDTEFLLREDLRPIRFQLELLKNPEAGDLIEETGGLRKIRFSDQRRNKGKRGGLRVIYYW